MVSTVSRLRARPHESTAHPGIAALLADAAAAVAQRWKTAAVVPGESGPALAALQVLTAAIETGLSGAPLPSLSTYAWTAEAPRLIGGLRRALLARWQQHGDAPNDVLRAIQQMELLLRALETDASAQFAEHVLGPNALQLLVEVAHDMRSPLGSIQFLVERMRRGQTGPVSPMQERHLDLVYSAAFGLSALTSDVMELAQGGARLVGAAVVPFSIGEVLRTVRDVVQPIAEEKKLTLRFSGPPGDLRLGHPAALHRVLLNLVTNALKFTNAGSVTVQADAMTPTAVRFLIADTGRGMPASVTARLADGLGAQSEARSRSQSEREADTVFSSAGLGLAICQKLVAAMGSRLTILAAHSPGSQLEFTLHLPALPQD